MSEAGCGDPRCRVDYCRGATMPIDLPIDFHGGNTWAVCKRAGRWRIYQRRSYGWVWHDVEGYGWVWHDVEDTLTEAHTAATQYAVIDELFAPGGLTRLAQMRLLWDAMSHH
jgi:hypothetical protein